MTKNSETLLLVQASPRGDRSRSRQLAVAYVGHWLAAHPLGRVVERDLAATQPSFVSNAWIEGAFTPPGTPVGAAATAALAESNRLIDELLAADQIVIATPIYNFHGPAVLKAWIDQIVRVGRTIGLGEKGPFGLVSRRPVRVLVASGDDFRPDGAYGKINFLEPHLRTVFGFLGMDQVDFIYASHQTAAEDKASAELRLAQETAREWALRT